MSRCDKSPTVVRRDALNRRGALRAGAIGLGGLTLPSLLRRLGAAEQANISGRSGAAAGSVIMLYLNGGPSQLDMWDMKPNGPSEIRGSFRPIQTSVPGIEICEHMPRMARLAEKYAVIRSMSHGDRGHPKANFHMMTGRALPLNRRAVLRSLSRQDHPHVGSALARVLGDEVSVPPFVMLPQRIRPTGVPHPGQFAGFLGAA